MQLIASTVSLTSTTLYFAAPLIHDASPFWAANRVLPWTACYVLWCLWFLVPAYLAKDAFCSIIDDIHCVKGFSMAKSLEAQTVSISEEDAEKRRDERQRRARISQRQMDGRRR